jgi:hypothetical protein
MIVFERESDITSSQLPTDLSDADKLLVFRQAQASTITTSSPTAEYLFVPSAAGRSVGFSLIQAREPDLGDQSVRFARLLWPDREQPRAIHERIVSHSSELPTQSIPPLDIRGTASSTVRPHAPRQSHSEAQEHRAQNERRIELIRKRTREGLSGTEVTELEELQAAIRRHVDAAHPLPTRYLSEIWQEARQAAARLHERTEESSDPG